MYYALVVRIRVRAFFRLTVRLGWLPGFYVHDGPGFLSEAVKNKSIVHLSSFQAFISVYTKFIRFSRIQHYKIDYDSRYPGESEIFLDVTLTKSRVLPLCTPVHKTLEQKEKEGFCLKIITVCMQ